MAQVALGDGAQEPLVVRAQIAVRGLVRAAAEEDRDAGAAAVELAVVVEAGARQRGYGDRGRAPPLGA